MRLRDCLVAALALSCLATQIQQHAIDSAAVPMTADGASGWTEGQVRAWLTGVALISPDHLAHFDGVTGAELLSLTEADLEEFTGLRRVRLRVLWNMLHDSARPRPVMADDLTTNPTLQPTANANPTDNPTANPSSPLQTTPVPMGSAPRQGCGEGEECAIMPHVLDAGERIVVFREAGGYGWGNQVRGMVYVVLYAILTNRRPVMDPAGKYVRYFGYQAAGATPPKTLAGAKALNQGECERDPVQCLRFKDQIIAHVTGVTMDPFLYDVPDVKAQIKKHFGSDNKALVTYEIIRWLFKMPTPQFVKAAEHHRHQVIGFPENMVIFQLRSWFDFKPRFKPEIMKQNSELLAGQFNSWHDALPAGKKAHGVYLTSDSTQGIDALAKALEGNERVQTVRKASNLVHTAHEKISDGTGENHISTAMIDWFLMGDRGVDAVFCSGTTFCISAIARVLDPPTTCYTYGRSQPDDKKGDWRDDPGEFDWPKNPTKIWR